MRSPSPPGNIHDFEVVVKCSSPRVSGTASSSLGSFRCPIHRPVCTTPGVGEGEEVFVFAVGQISDAGAQYFAPTLPFGQC